VISSLSDPAAFLRGAAALLKPRGRLLLSTLHPAFTPPAAKVSAGILGRLHARFRKLVVLNYVLEQRVTKVIQGSGVPPLPYHHRTLSTLVGHLGAAGLAITWIGEPRPNGTSAVARNRATAHALRAPLFLLMEAQPHRIEPGRS
jgi:hypothetical protein